MKYLSIALLLLVFSCKKTSVPTSSVIYGLHIAQPTILADGVTLDTVSVKINKETVVSKRFVTFQLSSGNFVNGTNSVITVPATLQNDELVASAFFVSPLKPQSIDISASPKLDSSVSQFILRDVINAMQSQAASIHLETSSFAIKPNYQSEVTLTATLKNSTGNPVSIGTSVIFEDVIKDGLGSKGNFRLVNAKSDSTSKTSAIYSIPNVVPGTAITLRVTVLDQNGHSVNISDSLNITVTP